MELKNMLVLELDEPTLGKLEKLGEHNLCYRLNLTKEDFKILGKQRLIDASTVSFYRMMKEIYEKEEIVTSCFLIFPDYYRVNLAPNMEEVKLESNGRGNFKLTFPKYKKEILIILEVKTGFTYELRLNTLELSNDEVYRFP